MNTPCPLKLNKILSMYNLYTYHSFMEAFIILKLRLPTTLFSVYHLAHNKHTRLIAPSPSSSCLFISSLRGKGVPRDQIIGNEFEYLSDRGGVIVVI